MAQNLPNGVPPQMNARLGMDKPNPQFNGVHSSQSSRDSSPLAFSGQIPPSQLPPSRPPQIPPSQLPPSASHSPINVAQKMGQLTLNNSPSSFGSSTPNTSIQPPSGLVNSAFSPINPVKVGNSSAGNPVLQATHPQNNRPPPPEHQKQGFQPIYGQQVNHNNHVQPPFPPRTTNNTEVQPVLNKPVVSSSSQSYFNQPSMFGMARPPPSQQPFGATKPPQPTQPYGASPNNQPPTYPKQFSQNAAMNKPITPQLPPQPPMQQQLPSQPPMQQQLPPQTQFKTNLHTNRYPPPANNFYQQQQPPQQYQQQQQQQQYQPQVSAPYNQFGPQQPSNVTQSGFNRLWGHDNFDLLQNPNVLPKEKVLPPKIYLGNEVLDAANSSSEVFRCTMTKIPESSSLLQKSRLPLGILIHPFKDLTHLPVIQCNVIVRCRTCRTYINPFVMFVDTKRWKCNLCYRINELPEEFQFDPVSKTYGDPSRRPEVRSSTIEYIAPAEYMLRPPQPAVYLFLFDISRLAVESGYLQTVCSVLLEELENLPGDARTQLGIIAYDSALHFYSLAEGLNQPHEMTVLDIDDIFLPCPDNLLVNLKDRMDLLKDLLVQLPTRYNNSYSNSSALGAALQAAHKMMSATGGRVTVFQASIPNLGPGALTAREDPSQRASTEVSHLNPANDFYKRLALECSGQQIAVDLFIVNSQYVDIATISGISRFSGGCIHHFPLFKASRVLQNERLERCFRRYLTRKIGFEAVMRIRCTRGLSIHTFHGNFFVRSTDLLSLPNVNPDAGFGMQVAIDENLSDVQSVCFQAALLYTSSKGERRIRVHTICLPICATLSDVINSTDQQCIVGLLAKMAVDRSMQSSLADAREAFINVAIDVLSSYKLSLNMGSGMSGLLAPDCLRLLPLYISALLKYTSFRTGTSTRLDDRVKAMIDMKTRPVNQLIQLIYPDLYPVHSLEEQPLVLSADEQQQIHQPPHLQLTARCLDSHGVYLMDMGEHMIMLVSAGAPPVFLNQVLGVPDYRSISDEMYELPILDNLHNQRLHQFIQYLNDDKPFPATLQIIRDNSPNRVEFYERLIEDRVENALSYHEFLQHLKTQIK